MGQHGVENIDYTRFLVAASIALAADTEEVAAKLEMMQVLSLLDIIKDGNNMKTIVVS